MQCGIVTIPKSSNAERIKEVTHSLAHSFDLIIEYLMIECYYIIEYYYVKMAWLTNQALN